MKKLFTLFFALLCLVMGVSTAQAQTTVTPRTGELSTTNGWASFTAIGSDFTVDNGIAYIATGISVKSNGTRINLVSVDVIPEGEGVFIEADDARKSPIVTASTTTKASKKSNNWIVGCSEESVFLTESDNAYVIALASTGSNGTSDNGGVMKVATTNNKVEIPVGYAYFVDKTASGAKSFTFDFETDGIENVNKTEDVKTVEYYNLAGQKVDANCKGVVIGSNGKKYFNK